MADRIEVHQPGVVRAAETCRSTGADALTELTRLLNDLTKSAIEAAAGHDDYGRQITDGWTKSGAETLPVFAQAIESQLIARGDQMTACGRNMAATDGDAAQQVRATDLGLTQTAGGWSQAPPPAGEK